MNPDVPGARPKPKKAVIIILVLVIAVLLLLAVSHILALSGGGYLQARINHAISGLTGQQRELADAIYLLSPQNGAFLVSEKGKVSGLENVSLAEKTGIIDAARGPEALALITYNWGSKLIEVVYDGKILASSPLHKRSVAVSPDGTLVAYAEAPSEGEHPESVGWNIIVVSSADGKEVKRFEGFLPYFLEDGTLLLFTPIGLGAVDARTGEPQGGMSVPFRTVSLPSAQSADRSLIAWTDSASGKAMVYKVNASSPLKLVETAAIPVNPGGSLALTPASLFRVSYPPLGSPEKSSEVWRFKLDGTDSGMIYKFRKNQGVVKMIP